MFFHYQIRFFCWVFHLLIALIFIQFYEKGKFYTTDFTAFWSILPAFSQILPAPTAAEAWANMATDPSWSILMVGLAAPPIGPGYLLWRKIKLPISVGLSRNFHLEGDVKSGRMIKVMIEGLICSWIYWFAGAYRRRRTGYTSEYVYKLWLAHDITFVKGPSRRNG